MYVSDAHSPYVDNLSGFAPEYDADGNQTRVKTSTGIYSDVFF